MKYVYEQIFLSGCAINSLEGETSDAVITISIPLPDPEKCTEYIDEVNRVSILTEH